MKSFTGISILLFLFLSSVTSSVFAEADKNCYLHILKAGNFSMSTIESTAMPLFEEFVEPLSQAPFTGINIFKKHLCLYKVSVSTTNEGLSLSISGRKMNAIAISPQFGINGLNHAFLRAIYRSMTETPEKNRICAKYKDIMKQDCKSVSGAIALYDTNGRVIPDGATVHTGEEFFFSLQPEVTLHAYIISKDAKGNFFRIFPNPDVSKYQNPLKQGLNYVFPPEKSPVVFAFDENTGKETFFVILSSTPMEDLDEVFKKLEEGSDTGENLQLLAQRIHTRGMGMVKKKKKTNLPVVSAQAQKIEQQLVNVLEGKGALVKKISLLHIN